MLRAHVTAFAFCALLLAGLWQIGGGGHFWPAFMLVPWGMALAWHVGGSWSVRRMLRIAPRRRRLTA